MSEKSGKSGSASPEKKSNSLNRRDFLKRAAMGSAGIFTLGGFNGAPAINGLNKDEFSFVHMTDMHVRRARKGDEGYARCVEHVNAIDPKPDFVLMGGDGPFDGLYTEKDEFEDQIGLYKAISDDLDMPYYNMIGNHDILGWNARRKVSVDDPDIGKTLFMRKMGMDDSYYSFNRNGWHFIMLDCIYPVEVDHGPSYIAKIGEEQLDWLRFDLAAHAHMPVIAVTHIAAFSNLGQIRQDRDMPSIHGRVIQNTQEFRHVLERHGNVRAVLQGHTHINEDYRYNDIWYITSQSVSAAWWGGNWIGFDPGYNLFRVSGEDLKWERHTFPWDHHLEPEDDLERERIAEREAFEEQQELLRREEREKARSDEHVK